MTTAVDPAAGHEEKAANQENLPEKISLLDPSSPDDCEHLLTITAGGSASAPLAARRLAGTALGQWWLSSWASSTEHPLADDIVDCLQGFATNSLAAEAILRARGVTHPAFDDPVAVNALVGSAKLNLPIPSPALLKWVRADVLTTQASRDRVTVRLFRARDIPAADEPAVTSCLARRLREDGYSTWMMEVKADDSVGVERLERVLLEWMGTLASAWEWNSFLEKLVSIGGIYDTAVLARAEELVVGYVLGRPEWNEFVRRHVIQWLRPIPENAEAVVRLREGSRREKGRTGGSCASPAPISPLSRTG